MSERCKSCHEPLDRRAHLPDCPDRPVDYDQFIKDNAVAIVEARDAKIRRQAKELSTFNLRIKSHSNERKFLLRHVSRVQKERDAAARSASEGWFLARCLGSVIAVSALVYVVLLAYSKM